MARRTIGGVREIGLGHAPAGPPSAQEHAKGNLLMGHARSLVRPASGRHDLQGQTTRARRSFFDLRSHRFWSAPGAISVSSKAAARSGSGGAIHRMEDEMNEAQQLADRYVAVWSETDPERRRRAIAELWTPDGEHYVGAREVRGYDELEQRIKGSHEKNIRD